MLVSHRDTAMRQFLRHHPQLEIAAGSTQKLTLLRRPAAVSTVLVTLPPVPPMSAETTEPVTVGALIVSASVALHVLEMLSAVPTSSV